MIQEVPPCVKGKYGKAQRQENPHAMSNDTTKGGVPMELWDLYTRDRHPTGETHIRGEKLPPERYHLVVHVWIRNSRGEWLISQRAASRPTFPLMWESVGGSVTAGEDSLTGAIREAEEEVGVRLDPAQGRLVNSTVRECFQDIKDDWLFLYDGPIDLRNATTDEVADMRWMSVEEIRKLYDAGELVHTLGYFFDDPELGGTAT
jgi:8-oxo-dGTP pyrophosphatase MutT (NUDIX family)